MAHRAKKNTQRSRPTGGATGGPQRGGAPSTRGQPPAPASSPTPSARPVGEAPAPTPATDAAITATPPTANRTSASTPSDVATPINATDATASAPDAPTDTPLLEPPLASGASGAFWRTWSNRRLFSVGAVAIGVVIVFSLLIHGLLTPAAAATVTPNVNAAPQATDAAIGHYAPNVTLVDLSNNRISLASLKGKIVVFNFWYAACDPCRYEMPALEKAYLKYKAQGVVVVGADVADNAQTASSYVHSLGVTYPIVLDQNLTAVQTFKVVFTPTTFFIDRQGVIRYKSIGSLTTATLDTDLTALLKQK